MTNFLGLRCIVVFFALWRCASPVLAQTTPAGETGNKIPPALEHYKGREIAQTMHYLGAPWLTRESRDREEDCNKLLRELKLEPGQTVCDMGCGNGFYTLRIAKRVGAKGLVYAVDIQPEMLSLLSERTKADRVHNVKPLLGTVVDPQLPAESCDVILCVDVYHEFSHPEQMLAAMRKALKPKGRLVLVEFRMEDPQVPIKLEHKMSKEQILKELPPNGFKLAQQFDGLPWQHVMWFEKDEAK
ncbi:MAG: class I SAM-dependent methyltransferase [Pirellulales bacterium]